MHRLELLPKLFKKSSKTIDKRLHNTLLLSASTLCRTKELSIFGIGRNLKSRARVKHSIKRVDRLVGNKSVHKQKEQYYKEIASHVIGENSRPIILIDWSGLTPCGTYYLLRASVPVDGRSITIFECSTTRGNYTSRATHKMFLNQIHELLPQGCCPIIVTDAGFRCTWFKLVINQGWDFVGRVRNKVLYKTDELTEWKPAKSLYLKAKNKVRYLFKGALSKQNTVYCHFHLKKEPKKFRIRKNLAGKKIQSSVSLKHAKGGNEPWLIATSLAPELFCTDDIIQFYAKRMSIEESFRDLKNTLNGFRFRNCRSMQLERLEVLLLIGAIAHLMLWLLGACANRKSLQYAFQANTIRHRKVLSNVYLGWQCLIKQIHFSVTEVFKVIDEIKEMSYTYKTKGL